MTEQTQLALVAVGYVVIIAGIGYYLYISHRPKLKRRYLKSDEIILENRKPPR